MGARKRTLLAWGIAVASLALLVGVLGMPNTASPAAAQTLPGQLFQRYADALNSGDVDAATELFADDAVVTAIIGACYPAECIGKDAIRNHNEFLVAAHTRVAIVSSEVSGNMASGTAGLRADHLRAAGADRILGSYSVQMSGGKISEYRFFWSLNDAQTLGYFAFWWSHSRGIELGPGPDAAQPGWAALSGFGGETHVVITIAPGPAGVPQPVRIHHGTCADLGAVAFPLQDVAGGKSGTGLDVPLNDLRTGNYAIAIQKSDDEPDLSAACGNIPAPAAPVVIEEGKVVVIEEGLVPVDSGFAEVNGARLWYEVYGEGEPLLLLGGTGANHLLWAFQVPVYAREFKVIVFDKRGTGQTSFPEGAEWTTPVLADEAAGLLDALGVDAAHVLGVSGGGWVAQEMALRHPEKVRSLILSAAMPGGTHSVWPDTEADAVVNECQMRGTWTSACVDLLYSPSYLTQHASELVWFGQLQAGYPAIPGDLLSATFGAQLRHDTYDRLPGITAPTLVIAGTDDRLAPAANARILSERIPGSELVLIEGGRHQYFIEKRAETDAAVLDFLRRHSAAAPAPAPAAALPSAGSGGLLGEEGSGLPTWWYALAAGGTLLLTGGLAGLCRARGRR